MDSDYDSALAEKSLQRSVPSLLSMLNVIITHRIEAFWISIQAERSLGVSLKERRIRSLIADLAAASQDLCSALVIVTPEKQESIKVRQYNPFAPPARRKRRATTTKAHCSKSSNTTVPHHSNSVESMLPADFSLDQYLVYGTV